MKIDDKRTLQSYLTTLFEQGVKSALHQRALDEKEKQAKTSGGSGGTTDDGGVDLFGGGGGADDGGNDAPSGDDTSDDDTNATSKTMDDETEKLKQGDIKAKDVIEKLNSIRSGKSFKDSAVQKPMEDYVDSLAKPEKVALLAFLKGISQIVTGEVPAQKAEDPGKHPADVKMNKTNEPHVIHKTPNVIKGPQKSAGAPAPVKKGAPPEEDDSAPKQVSAPITAKRR